MIFFVPAITPAPAPEVVNPHVYPYPMDDDGQHQARPLDDEGLTERERAIVARTCGELIEHAESIFGCHDVSIDDVAVLPDGRVAVFEPGGGDRVIYFAIDPRSGDEVVVEASSSYLRSADPQTGATVTELILPCD